MGRGGKAERLFFSSFSPSHQPSLALRTRAQLSRVALQEPEKKRLEEAGVMGVMGSNLVEASDFLGGLSVQLLLSCFTTAKITFTCIVYPQFIYIIYIICSLYGSSCCI